MMKILINTGKRLLPILLVAGGAFGVSAQADEYDIDLSHSFILFKTKHLGYSWLHGRFNQFSGVLKYDPTATPDNQSIEIVIDVASVDSNWEARDKHLREADFLDVDQYPQATFKSSGFSGNANGGTLSGDLTLHGVTKSITFDIKKIGEGKDPWGGYRVGFEGQYTLKRADFGMTYNLGPAAEEVIIDLHIEAVRPQ